MLAIAGQQCSRGEKEQSAAIVECYHGLENKFSSFVLDDRFGVHLPKSQRTFFVRQ
jgi:hypothetical protein